MEWVIRGRQEGKTTNLVEWVKEGDEVNSWPGWNRVIIVPDMRQATYLANTHREQLGLDYHQVFSLRDWQTRSYGAQRNVVDVALDNADIILRDQLLGPRTRLVRVTATGEVI